MTFVTHAQPRILVQKFGGSSVASAEGRALLVSKVQRALDEGYAPLVVVSAMGRKGDPYATDTLLSQLDFVPHTERDRRELDMLMACGEIISVVVCAHALRHKGIPAAALAGSETGLLTDGAHTEAHIHAVDPSVIQDTLNAGRVPVVAGFQGVGPDGNVTTLGRGGSDTTAVAVGVGVQAEAVEIYSDVEGVMTVDPRVFAGAGLIAEMSYEELGELAVEGARVMHPRAVDLAGARDVPLCIRSTFNATPGTVVRALPGRDALEQQRVVTGISPLRPVAHLVVPLPADPETRESRVEAIFELLTAREISLDLINICPDALYFVVKQPFLETVEAVLAGLGQTCRIRRDCAKISLVGAGMRGTPGVVGRIHRTLRRAGIAVLHSTDSNITISCLVDGPRLNEAVEVLHREFFSPTFPRSTAPAGDVPAKAAAEPAGDAAAKAAADPTSDVPAKAAAGQGQMERAKK